MAILYIQTAILALLAGLLLSRSNIFWDSAFVARAMAAELLQTPADRRQYGKVNNIGQETPIFEYDVLQIEFSSRTLYQQCLSLIRDTMKLKLIGNCASLTRTQLQWTPCMNPHIRTGSRCEKQLGGHLHQHRRLFVLSLARTSMYLTVFSYHHLR